MKSYQNLKEWRRNTKQKLVEALGSCCQICKYNKSNSALELHHTNPAQKDFALSSGKISKNWNSIKEEASKCILLCANCHREIHDGTTQIPETYQHFDESLILSNKEKEISLTPCIVCKKLKHHSQIYCSHECHDKQRSINDWSQIDLVRLIEIEKISKRELGRRFNCSDNAIKKQYLKQKRINQLS